MFFSPTGGASIAMPALVEITIGADATLLLRGRGGGGRRSIDARRGIGGGTLPFGVVFATGNGVVIEDPSDKQLAVFGLLRGCDAPGDDNLVVRVAPPSCPVSDALEVIAAVCALAVGGGTLRGSGTSTASPLLAAPAAFFTGLTLGIVVGGVAPGPAKVIR